MFYYVSGWISKILTVFSGPSRCPFHKRTQYRSNKEDKYHQVQDEWFVFHRIQTFKPINKSSPGLRLSVKQKLFRTKKNLNSFAIHNPLNLQLNIYFRNKKANNFLLLYILKLRIKADITMRLRFSSCSKSWRNEKTKLAKRSQNWSFLIRNITSLCRKFKLSKT